MAQRPSSLAFEPTLQRTIAAAIHYIHLFSKKSISIRLVSLTCSIPNFYCFVLLLSFPPPPSLSPSLSIVVTLLRCPHCQLCRLLLPFTLERTTHPLFILFSLRSFRPFLAVPQLLPKKIRFCSYTCPLAQIIAVTPTINHLALLSSSAHKREGAHTISKRLLLQHQQHQHQQQQQPSYRPLLPLHPSPIICLFPSLCRLSFSVGSIQQCLHLKHTF
ncbi:hypothetical protein GQ42DRAFT_20820 [Ramicandelaber brevisporus]|nr:hypothetical protein GQ42DRAFT_20820 [Ramicandelaber brevisporus]